MTYRELADELSFFTETHLDREVMVFNQYDNEYYVLSDDLSLTFTDVDNEFGADYPYLVI